MAVRYKAALTSHPCSYIISLGACPVHLKDLGGIICYTGKELLVLLVFAASSSQMDV